MKLEEFKAYLDSEEGQASLDKAAQEMIKSAEHENRWIERFKARYENNLDEAVRKLKAKYNSKAYIDREYRLGREPDERLLWLVWNYSQKYCKPCFDQKYFNQFTAEAFYIGSYVISIMHGQGSVISVERTAIVDNIEKIKPLLNFENEGDFYMLYVFKRKKDQPEGEKDNHQSVRTIRSYCIKSIEQLEKRYEEIKMMCEMFKARAYIHIQKQNHKDVSLEMMVALAQKIRDGQHEQQGLFDSVVGSLKTYEKRWIVDVDTHSLIKIGEVVNTIKECKPEGGKLEAMIPTPNGVHLITKRFDVMEFAKYHPEIDIQKKNPTLLYYPDSLGKVTFKE